MKIWCISDTHCKHKELILPDPTEVDMVIHAGDVSTYGELSLNDIAVKDFLDWFTKLPYKYKIYIPGNHDISIEANVHNIPKEVIILKHESIIIEGIKIFGSPYTPSFGVGWAYNKSRSSINKYWDNIPIDTDILITHGPPKGILDYTAPGYDSSYVQCGCASLLNTVIKIKPKYHIFGHIHNEKNVINSGVFKPSNMSTTFINASTTNLRNEIVNNGIIIET